MIKKQYCSLCGMPIKVVGGHPDFISDTIEGCTMHYEPDLPSEEEIRKMYSEYPAYVSDEEQNQWEIDTARKLLKRIKEGK